MSTPPRPRKARPPRPATAFVAIIAWCGLAAYALAGSPGVVILSGLGEPIGVAVRSAPRGAGVEVFVSEAGRVKSSVWQEGEPPVARVAVEGLPTEPITLGWLSPELLLVASSDAAVYQPDDRDAVRDPLSVARAAKQGGLIRSVTANARFVYVVSEGALLRSRRVGKRLTALRIASTTLAQPTAIAISPLGYLVVLHRAENDGDEGSWRLAFLDPEQPEKRGSVLPVTGLSRPIQLAYGESTTSGEGLLYVLDAGGDGPPSSGVYRIDSAFNDAGRAAAVARQVLEVERPTAFAVGPDRAIYVASSAEGGRVIRWLRGQDD